MNNATKTTITKGNLVIDGAPYAGDFQKEGTLTQQLRQTVTTVAEYPSKKVSNEFNGSLFDAKEFGFEPQIFTSTEERVAWTPVPTNVTEAQIADALGKQIANGACIYRVLSNAPILSKDQLYSIEAGQKTRDDYANAQVLRFPENEATLKDGTAGTLILDSEGRVQYRKTFYWSTAHEDVDIRGEVEEYRSSEIEEELTGATTFAGQQVQ